MENRVVITGLGVVAPNGVGVENFTQAIKAGKSGISYVEELEALNFRCRVAGVPQLSEESIEEFCKKYKLRGLMSSGILYGCMAGMEAWLDAALPIPEKQEQPDWDSGCIIGCGMTGVETLEVCIRQIDVGAVKKIGGRKVQQSMNSGISAYLGGMLGLGNQVTTNASACATGTEAILMAYERIKMGMATRMLAGGCESNSKYIWGGFDAMRVLSSKFNDQPERASRPMSASAAGFVPGSGAGALLLESLESAKQRGAKIYAEVLGGACNSGGHRQGGSMTAPNQNSVVKCIETALNRTKIQGEAIDAVSGHLTATIGDPREIKSISTALKRKNGQFPYVNALKSMIGHCLSAAGAIESVAAVKQLEEGFFHPSLNIEDVHPEIVEMIDADKIPTQTRFSTNFDVMLKTSFGFGDVNSCLVLKKW